MDKSTRFTANVNFKDDIGQKKKVTLKTKAKMHNHPPGFGLVANRPPGVLILQYNHLGFLNW
jgi:hypothetical protein